MAKNASLHSAKKAKNDEFYTQLSDVAKELMHYKDHFKGKIVFCNCDDPTYSAFWKYFHLNFHELGLKKLISTHYDKENPTYKMEYDGIDHKREKDTSLSTQELDNDIEIGVKTSLQGNGDFRNQECIELLKEADIVVTNPPFSLFREYVTQLMEYNKKFIIIGNKNAINYLCPYIKNNKLWLGVTMSTGGRFYLPEGVDETKSSSAKLEENGRYSIVISGAHWFTNLDHKQRHEKLILWKNYTPEEYPKYDNYNAINVDKTVDIPIDYFDVIGVPITFLDKYCPEQFDIIGITYSTDKNPDIEQLRTDAKNRHNPVINGKSKYSRVLIKMKN